MDSVTKIPEAMLEEWRSTLCAFAKWPKYTIRSGDTQEQKIKILIHKSQQQLQSLWKSYAQDRSSLGARTLMHAASVTTYALGFHLPNAARGYFMWKRLLSEQPNLKKRFSNFPTIDIFDLGCGTGAATHATMHALDLDQRCFVTLLDQNRKMLEFANQILQYKVGKLSMIRTPLHLFRIHSLPRKHAPCAIVHMGYLLNELLIKPKQTEKLVNLLGVLNKRYSEIFVVVTDSAQEHIARFAQEFRGHLIRSLKILPLYPCPHAVQQCPMLDSTLNWCFSDFLWDRPQHVKIVDRFMRLDHSKLAVSGYIFASNLKHVSSRGATTVGFPPDRLTSEPHALLCTSKGLQKMPIDSKSSQPICRGSKFTSMD